VSSWKLEISGLSDPEKGSRRLIWNFDKYLQVGTP